MPEHVAPLGQADNLDRIADILEPVIDGMTAELGATDAIMTLAAAALDLLPAGRCTVHYREALLEIRAECDRLLAELQEPTH